MDIRIKDHAVYVNDLENKQLRVKCSQGDLVITENSNGFKISVVSEQDIQDAVFNINSVGVNPTYCTDFESSMISTVGPEPFKSINEKG